jgi:glycerol-3-phosphate dehydrogenase subunit B
VSFLEDESTEGSQRTVLVVGGGVAATAAALAATRGGASVIVLDGGAGASMLSTGAIDLVPWHEAEAAGTPVPAATRSALQALGGYVLDEGGTSIVTTAGVLRPAAGRDAALLNVSRLAGQRIAVVRCARPGWDADAFALAWGPAFQALDAVVLRHTGEDLLPDGELAARHDDASRLGWLAERLREALATAGGQWTGIVVPPLLGVERARAHELSEHVRVRCGEAAGLPGGAPGLRFENARDRALAACGATRAPVRIRSIHRSAGCWRATGETGSSFDGAAVVLAIGGLVGGGLEYAPAEATLATALPQSARRPLKLTLDAAVTLGAYGRPLEVSRSLFGPPPEAIARPFVRDSLLDRAGILAGVDGGASSAPGIFAAGDVVADAPRSWLAALSSGARAGSAAARYLGSRHVTESARPSADAEPASRP